MTGMRRARGAGDTHGMTCVGLGFLGSGRLVVIVWAWFNSLVMCFDYSTGQHTVNTGSSVKLAPILHLTASGGGGQGGLGQEEKIFFNQAGRLVNLHPWW